MSSLVTYRFPHFITPWPNCLWKALVTDLYSEQQTGMRFSAFPLLVPHKHVPGYSQAGAAAQTCLPEGLPERNLLKTEVAGKE